MNLETTNFAGFRFDTEKIFKVWLKRCHLMITVVTFRFSQDLDLTQKRFSMFPIWLKRCCTMITVVTFKFLDFFHQLMINYNFVEYFTSHTWMCNIWIINLFLLSVCKIRVHLAAPKISQFSPSVDHEHFRCEFLLLFSMNLKTTNFAGFRFDTEKVVQVSYLSEKKLHDDHSCHI